MVSNQQTIEKDLCNVFSSEWLRKTSRETMFVIRERKINPTILFWIFVFGFGVRRQHSLASLKRDYEKASNCTLSDGSWYERFTPELATFFKTCVIHAIEHLAEE